MLHACVQRFDVTENIEKFYKILGTKHALIFLHLDGCPRLVHVLPTHQIEEHVVTWKPSRLCAVVN